MLSRSRWPHGLRPVCAGIRLLVGLVCRFENHRGHHTFLVNVVRCAGRDFCGWPIPHPTARARRCVCVRVRVVCNSNFLHLQWVGRRDPTKKD